MENKCKKILLVRGIDDKEEHFMSNLQRNEFVFVFLSFYNG